MIWASYSQEVTDTEAKRMLAGNELGMEGVRDDADCMSWLAGAG